MSSPPVLAALTEGSAYAQLLSPNLPYRGGWTLTSSPREAGARPLCGCQRVWGGVCGSEQARAHASCGCYDWVSTEQEKRGRRALGQRLWAQHHLLEQDHGERLYQAVEGRLGDTLGVAALCGNRQTRHWAGGRLSLRQAHHAKHCPTQLGRESGTGAASSVLE